MRHGDYGEACTGGGARVAHAGGGAARHSKGRRMLRGGARLWVVPVSEAAEGQRARAAVRVRRTQAVVQHSARQGQAHVCGCRLPVVVGLVETDDGYISKGNGG